MYCSSMTAQTRCTLLTPPYVLSTRVLRNSSGCYRHEMSDDDHIELLGVLRELQGMVVLSGYASDLYAEELPGWISNSTDARISSGRGTALRTEVAWLNPACANALNLQHGGLFSGLVTA